MKVYLILALLMTTLISLVLFQNFTTTPDPTYCERSSKDLKRLELDLGQRFRGFGCNTVGGLRGTRCEVTSLEDHVSSPTKGTLRYCLEKGFNPGHTETPVVVFFNSSLAGKKILLKAPINISSNTTIDGRMPKGLTPVTITNRSVPVENPCHPDSQNSKNSDIYGMCDINNGNPGVLPQQNGQPRYIWSTNLGSKGRIFNLSTKGTGSSSIDQVIISDLVLTGNIPKKFPASLNDNVGTSSFSNPCYFSNTSVATQKVAGPRYVVGCPVMIDIGDEDPETIGRTTNIVIANNEIYQCGEKCIRGSGSADGISILRNYIHDAYFTALLTMSANYNLSRNPTKGHIEAPLSRYTIYENHFERVVRRNPRCASYVWCHIYGNIISNWGSPEQGGFAISAESGSLLVTEFNFFEAPKSFSAENPAIFITNSTRNPDKTFRDDPTVFIGRWALVKDGVVQKPIVGNLFVDYSKLPKSSPKPQFDSRPFEPRDFYSYSLQALRQASYDSIKAMAGPRQLP